MLEILKALTIRIAQILRLKADKSELEILKTQLKDHQDKLNVITGKRVSVNINGEVFQGNYEELASQLNDSEVTTIVYDSTGLEEFRFELESRSINRVNVNDLTQDFTQKSPNIFIRSWNDNINFKLQIFDWETKRLVFETTTTGSSMTYGVPRGRQWFAKITKLGNDTDYSFLFTKKHLGGNHSYIITNPQDVGTLLLLDPNTPPSNLPNLLIGKFKTCTFHYLYVDDVEVSKAEYFLMQCRGFHGANADYYTDYRSDLRYNTTWASVISTTTTTTTTMIRESRGDLYLYMKPKDTISGYTRCEVYDGETNTLLMTGTTSKFSLPADQVPKLLGIKLYTT